MDSWDLKKWRKKHGFNQFEAAKSLGINRGGYQNWEREIRPISRAVVLACDEITRLQWQRPEFGPVILMFTDGEIIQHAEEPYRVSIAHNECHPNNASAIAAACRLASNPLYGDPLIFAEDGSVIWESRELLDECRKRRSTDV